MLNVGVIGIGNCGNQIALLAKKEANCDVYAINSCESDLAMLPDDIPKKSVGGGEGSGKNRQEAKKFLKGAIMSMITEDSFKSFMTGKDVIIVASSTGGGSGSGMAPILSDIIQRSFTNPDGSMKIVILVGVLPRLAEGWSTQVNAMDYAHELYDVLEKPTYMIYDNNNFKDQKSYQVLENVNREIVEDIKIMQCRYNYPTPYDSIDDRDMKILLSGAGRIAFFRLEGIKEKDLDANNLEDMMIEKIKHGAHAELQRDGIVHRTGLITNLDTRLNEQFDSHISKIRSFVGEPVEEFLHITVNKERSLPNNIFLILTGLSKISDRLLKIEDRIAEIEAQRIEKEKSMEPAFSGLDEQAIAEMNKKRGYREPVASPEKTDLAGIFGKFGV